MPDSPAVELSKYRLTAALETLETAKLLFENSKYKDSLNRSYYAIFHAMRAMLALEGVDFKKHSGIISHFREKYIKTNIFSQELSAVIGRASLIRNQSDYEDFFLASAEEAEAQIEDAQQFCDEIEAYLNVKYQSIK